MPRGPLGCEISENARKCLLILSYFHSTDIPHSMILFAARRSFSSLSDIYLDRQVESLNTAKLLASIFGGPEVEGLGDLLLSLETDSHVAIDRNSDGNPLRLHPTVQVWAQDILKCEGDLTYRDAAVRILSSCASKHKKEMHHVILPHVRKLSAHWSFLHPSDKAAFADILWQFSPDSAITLWKEAYSQVKASNPDELAHARLLLKLGKGHLHAGPLSEAELVNKQALDIRRRFLGPSHLETIQAQAYLGFVYFALGRYSDAEKLQVEVLKIRRRCLGGLHLDTVAAAAKLALTLNSLGRPTEAKPLQEESLRLRLALLKEEHPDSLTSMSNLATTYTHLGRHAHAERLRARVLELRKKILGEDHIDTIISSENLAVTFYSQKRYHEARVLQEDVLHRYERIFEPGYVQIALGMSHLASTYYKLGMITEAEELACQAEGSQRRVLKPEHVHYKHTAALLRKIRRRRRMRLFCPVFL